MQIETLETKRTPEGAIDVRHYARAANAERRQARNKAMRGLARGSKRVMLAIIGFVAFWNIPALGPSAKDWPFR